MNASLSDCEQFSEFMEQFVSVYSDVISHAEDMERNVREKKVIP